MIIKAIWKSKAELIFLLNPHGMMGKESNITEKSVHNCIISLVPFCLLTYYIHIPQWLGNKSHWINNGRTKKEQRSMWTVLNKSVGKVVDDSGKDVI